MTLRVEHGQQVERGDRITAGSLSPHDILRISGVEAVQNYLIQEVQAVYRQQGVDINDKHIEVIVRQMMRKVKVEEAGDTSLLTGATVDTCEFEDANAADAGAHRRRRDRPAAGDLLAGAHGHHQGLLWRPSPSSPPRPSRRPPRSSPRPPSSGKVDHLVGLKENVIIGKLIPAGSGLAAYRDFEPGVTPESSVTQDMIDSELY